MPLNPWQAASPPQHLRVSLSGAAAGRGSWWSPRPNSSAVCCSPLSVNDRGFGGVVQSERLGRGVPHLDGPQRVKEMPAWWKSSDNPAAKTGLEVHSLGSLNPSLAHRGSTGLGDLGLAPSLFLAFLCFQGYGHDGIFKAFTLRIIGLKEVERLGPPMEYTWHSGRTLILHEQRPCTALKSTTAPPRRSMSRLISAW